MIRGRDTQTRLSSDTSLPCLKDSSVLWHCLGIDDHSTSSLEGHNTKYRRMRSSLTCYLLTVRTQDLYIHSSRSLPLACPRPLFARSPHRSSRTILCTQVSVRTSRRTFEASQEDHDPSDPGCSRQSIIFTLHLHQSRFVIAQPWASSLSMHHRYSRTRARTSQLSQHQCPIRH